MSQLTRKGFLWILIGLLVFGGFWWWQHKEGNQGATTDSTEKTTSYTFLCPSGVSFLVTYKGESSDTATLTLPTGTYELRRAVSASGARYTNDDESVVFWEHAGEAMIEVNGERVLSGCKSSFNA